VEKLFVASSVCDERRRHLRVSCDVVYPSQLLRMIANRHRTGNERVMHNWVRYLTCGQGFAFEETPPRSNVRITSRITNTVFTHN
jgi:hypothetical protein